jgi:hypothetical protein
MSWRINAEPMKPAPPVTSRRFDEGMNGVYQQR